MHNHIIYWAVIRYLESCGYALMDFQSCKLILISILFLFLQTGEVIEGMDIVKTIEQRGSSAGKTRGTITIANSGTI